MLLRRNQNSLKDKAKQRKQLMNRQSKKTKKKLTKLHRRKLRNSIIYFLGRNRMMTKIYNKFFLIFTTELLQLPLVKVFLILLKTVLEVWGRNLKNVERILRNLNKPNKNQRINKIIIQSKSNQMSLLQTKTKRDHISRSLLKPRK